VSREAIEAHYVACLGHPGRRARFRTGDRVIEILKWNADANPQGVALYATLGGSDQPPSTGADPTHRSEFVLGLLPEEDAVASALATLALHAGELGHGHTMRFGEPLWADARMNGFLVMRPIEPVVPTLEFPDEKHCEFLDAIPIYESEVDFKARHGAERLMDVWQEAQVPFWDPNRDPLPA
jgi:hypothetical protein